MQRFVCGHEQFYQETLSTAEIVARWNREILLTISKYRIILRSRFDFPPWLRSTVYMELSISMNTGSPSSPTLTSHVCDLLGEHALQRRYSRGVGIGRCTGASDFSSNLERHLPVRICLGTWPKIRLQAVRVCATDICRIRNPNRCRIANRRAHALLRHTCGLSVLLSHQQVSYSRKCVQLINCDETNIDHDSQC